MHKILINLLLLFSRKEDFMMAMLWAQQIMMQETEEQKELYARVPRLLKEKVKKILIDSGVGHLVSGRNV